jgi:hypothetical protein
MFAVGQIRRTNVTNALGKPEALFNGIAYPLGNPEEIPYGANMGLFEYDPEDQFAYYVPLEKVEQAMKDYRAMNREFDREEIKAELGA